MNVDSFIVDIGGRSGVIAETGLTKGRISQWCREGRIPRAWVKYFREKYPSQCDKHGVTETLAAPAAYAKPSAVRSTARPPRRRKSDPPDTSGITQSALAFDSSDLFQGAVVAQERRKVRA